MHHTARFLAVCGILFLFLGSTGIAVSYAYFVNGESASLVIGQPDFTTSTCVSSPPTKTGLCGSVWFTFDNAGNLWVADAGNNRVLRFKTPFSTLEAASMVIGQPDFTSGSCATTQNGLCNPKGIAFDSSGNLWVGDRGNSRILEFKAPLSSGQGASLVLGQTSFTTSACSTTQSGLCNPIGIAFGPAGNVWISDGTNNRVLKFNAPFSNGELASRVIGQSDFTASTCATTQSGLCNPVDVGFDSSGNLWVSDLNNNRVLSYLRLTSD
ncbi:MAG TPA: NHL repeat-containing protein [Nitrososphaerales archaeon]|nr:NHL repeat-containing protein [Nitrososphaerales archaeon]